MFSRMSGKAGGRGTHSHAGSGGQRFATAPDAGLISAASLVRL